MNLLKFVKGGNAKLAKHIVTFSLPAGHSCPAALQCKAFADPHSGRITDGRDMRFRCYAASQEAAFPSVRQHRWHNFKLLRPLKTAAKITELIEASLPKKCDMLRIHASGDFYSQAYFDGWLEVIQSHPETIFYAYTKALDLWVKRLEELPENFNLVASYGGRHDTLIKAHKLKHVVAVGHPEEAARLKLPIDHDDSHAYTRGLDSFALLIHGTQPANSQAAADIKRMKAENVEFSYPAR